MKPTVFWTAVLLSAAVPMFAQEIYSEEIDPSALKVISDHEARNALGHVTASFGTRSTAAGSTSTLTTGSTVATATLPLWNHSFTAAQNNTVYNVTLVGTDPTATTSSTTQVATVLVPVIIKITQGGTTYTFDPTAADNGCLGAGHTGFSLTQNSPVFSNFNFSMNGQSVGITQYNDAFMRAQFWSTTSANGYHLLLAQAVGATLTISINAGPRGNTTAKVYALSGGQCGTNATTNPAGKLGVVNINTIDSLLQQYITNNGLNASQLPFFVTYNAVMSNGGANNTNNCCILGYHNALGSPGQTYGIGEFEGRNQTVFSGVSDISAITHEIAEWADDPSGSNPTPAWGGIGQVSSCQSNLEVGDPLSGTLFPQVQMPNGFIYHPQELAYVAWFYGGTSPGAGGVYSDNGTFKGYAKLCPPGGTN